MTRPPEPSAEGVAVKLARARIHSNTFKQMARELDFAGYPFGGKVYDGGSKHVYRVIHPPPLAPQFSAVLGDCLHNMRAALDHLAFQLVRASGRIPTTRTSFPLHASSTFWNDSAGAREPVTIDIHPGVSTDIREALEAVQPYHGTFEGQLLWWMKDLDNVDKHRQLVVTAHAARGFGTSRYEADGKTLRHIYKREGLVLSHLPLKHNDVVLTLPYDPPREDLDPSLHISIAVEIGEGGARGWEVGPLLDNMLDFLCFDLMPRFMPFMFKKP